jgi:hypothetical protein
MHKSQPEFTSYLKCPYLFYLTYKDKNAKRGLPSEPMIRGSRIHEDIAEKLTTGNLKEFNEKQQAFLKRYFFGQLHVEQEFYIDMVIFGMRGFIDLYTCDDLCCNIVDWKSGFMDGNPLQLQIYCLSMLENHPHIQSFRCFFYYTDREFYTTHVFTRDEILEFEDWLETKLIEMEYCESFEPNPSSFCNLCGHVGKCNEAQNYDTFSLSAESDFIELWKKVVIAEAFAKQGTELLKNYMIFHQIDNLTNEDQKLYLTSAVTMRKGKLTKAEKEKININKKKDLESLESIKQFSYIENKIIA